MPDKTLFYVWEDGGERYCVYDAVDGSDAWSQHCAAGLADVAERDYYTVAPLGAEAVNKLSSDLQEVLDG